MTHVRFSQMIHVLLKQVLATSFLLGLILLNRITWPEVQGNLWDYLFPNSLPV